jgi:predicted HicB family RNase H-like nuclease
MTMMRYGDYVARIDFEDESGLFHGRVVNLRDVVNFYGGSADELLAEFGRSVEEYLAVCKEEGIEPDKPYSGRFNVRLAPDLHRAIVEVSALSGKSLNTWVADELARAVQASPPTRGDKRGGRGNTRTRDSAKRKKGAAAQPRSSSA